MRQYVDLIKMILARGEERPDRTGTGTQSIFGGQLAFNLRQTFPLVTVKKTLYKSAFTEMLWFISGSSNTKFLTDRKIPIWDAWADKDGNLGPIYGVQWRKWPGKPGQEPIDQLKNLIDGIKKNPQGRRHIVTAWNPTYINDMGLPPCHRDFQCYVTNDGHLEMMVSIRSWDIGLGAPFNIAQYALLAHLIARATGLKAGRLLITYGDAHVYLNHVHALRDVVDTIQPFDCSPQLVVNSENTDIDGYKPEDFEITGYESGPLVKLPIAV